MKNQEQIYDALAMLSVVLNQPQDAKRLMFYAEALKEYDLRQVLALIKGFATKVKFFPQLVEIIEPLQGLSVPTDEMATMIASEIIESIARFGYSNLPEAKAHLGEKFQIVERYGGWEELCRIGNDQIPATRAQLRELAKAYINRSKRDASESNTPFTLNAEAKSIEIRRTELKLLKVDYDLDLKISTQSLGVK